MWYVLALLVLRMDKGLLSDNEHGYLLYDKLNKQMNHL